MALATLSIDIIAKLASLEAGLDKASRINAKTAADIEARWARVGASMRTLGSLIGTTFATQQLAAFFDRTVDGLDKLNDVKDVTGSTIEKISALEDIAARTGTTFEAVEGALVKFNSALKEADGKNGVSQALKAIGLDAAQLRQIDPAEALRLTAVALSKYADDGNKARLVQELFGKSVKEVGPYLKDLAEAGQLNATVTEKQALEAEKFNKQIFALQKNVTDAGRAFFSDLLPALNQFFERIDQKRKAYGSVTEGLLDNFRFDQADDVAQNLTKTFGELEAAQKRMAKVGGILGKEGLSDVLRRRYEAERTELEQQVKLLEKRQAYLYSAGADPGANDPTELARRGRGPKGSVGELPQAPASKSVSEAQRYLENLQKQVEKTRELNAYETALADIQAKRIDGITPKLEAQILAEAKLLDLKKSQLALDSSAEAFRRSEIEANDAVNKAMVSSQDEVAAKARTIGELLANTPSKALEVTRLEMQRLATAFENATITAAEYEEAVHAALGITASESKEATEFAQQAARNIQDALGSSLLSAMEGDFKNIGSLFESTVNRMIAQAVAADLAERLLGDFGKTGKLGGLAGDGLGYLGKLFGGGATGGTAGNNPSAFTAGGGGGFGGAIASFASMFAGFFDDGGRIAPGKFGVVGETQPELAFGGNSGLNIVPMKGGPAGGGKTINYAPTFVLQAPASRETQEQVAAMAFGGAQEAWGRQS